MAHHSLLLAFLPALLLVSHTTEYGSPQCRQTSLADTLQLPLQEVQSHRYSRGRRGLSSSKSRAGLRSHRTLPSLANPEEDRTGPESLSPVSLETGPGRDPLGIGSPSQAQGNYLMGSPSQAQGNYLMGTRKGRRHGHRNWQGHQFERKKQGRQNDKRRLGKEPELRFEDLPPSSASSRLIMTPSGEAPSPSIFGSSSALVTIVMNKHPPTLPTASTKPQRASRRLGEGEVMPTLDMTLFDWTDYEDMKPVDTWPASRKRATNNGRSKNGRSNGNGTVATEASEPCDHHSDCLPGSCCDLRQHECKSHNRGLNNKCYDDCMCEEGFRCYAKFHRKRRVTRRRGRCVAPGSVSSDQGGFIMI
ncbi:draxin [Takifugu rubripes]|uniref:Dorsal inhibitory axon guidance protein a n=1 Tax=Takifugu rubripes TaxID=31033 RepID=H2S173_TAKRU|nr:draxin [Takifugu rubripes]